MCLQFMFMVPKGGVLVNSLCEGGAGKSTAHGLGWGVSTDHTMGVWVNSWWSGVKDQQFMVRGTGQQSMVWGSGLTPPLINRIQSQGYGWTVHGLGEGTQALVWGGRSTGHGSRGIGKQFNGRGWQQSTVCGVRSKVDWPQSLPASPSE